MEDANNQWQERWSHGVATMQTQKRLWKKRSYDQTQIQTQTDSVWKRPQTPDCVNTPTNIQTTVIDNQQQFLYIHSTGMTALCTV